MYYKSAYASPLGTITLACDESGESLVGLWLNGQKHYGGSISSLMVWQDEIPLFGTVKKWLDRYFLNQKPNINELSLAPIGSEFRQSVWAILREIPYGEVITYADIAKKMAAKLGKEKMSAQAVGGAVGHNPISIIVPCHRVVGSNGSLTGFAGGVETKIKLLELEGADMSALFIPKKLLT